ncbi:hypothetical protein LSH36_297g02022 [Paralvinella palmiformis]|uniref:ERAP1-like C-terminal domain-containing protein n=1 Tax=Paralvinella palmiformis TaxID=53620 RepID=A0AAD9JI45_9ANNE|nr:hypothetical protein LSH36_297g02022 [Paralvinella palmiformis]
MLEAAALIDVPAAVNFAKGQFQNWMEFNLRISPDYAVVVYSVGIRHGGQAEWEYVWKKAKETKVASETEVMMSSLAHSQEPWLLWRYIRWSLDTGKIRMQDVRNLFSYFAVTPLGRSVALQFMLTEWDEINKRFGMDAYLLRDIIYATTSLINTDFEYKQLERLYRENPPAGFASKAAENSLALVRSNIYWMKLNHDTIYEWLKKNAGTDSEGGINRN